MKTGNIIVGDDTNGVFTDKKGRLHFRGTGRPYDFFTFHSAEVIPTHLDPLRITSLAAVNGIVTSGLDDAEGANQRIEVIGIDGGVHTKGRLSSAYSRVDTAFESCIVKIKLSTTNSTWDQAGGWRLILDIDSGNVTGTFTVFMPAFSMMEYSIQEFYVTFDGAVYSFKTDIGFDKSVAGSAAATELMSNDESDGLNVVVEVADTTGFYEGNLVFVSDSANSEWTRITTIVTNTSITVDTLTNSYTTAAGAKLDIINYVQTTPISPIKRGLFSLRTFQADINSGVKLQYGIPHTIDPTEDIRIDIQVLPTEANAGAAVSKWQIQYYVDEFRTDIPETIQYGTLINADIVPPVTVYNEAYRVGVIPSADHSGKHLLSMEIVRLGADSGDTYTGGLKLIAYILSIENKQLGYEV